MKDSLYRALIHAPLGALTAWSGSEHWVYAIVMLVAFLAYELTEDWRIKNNAYIDIRGYIAGFIATVIALEAISWAGHRLTTGLPLSQYSL